MWKMLATSLNSPTSNADLFVFYIASSNYNDMYGTQIVLGAYRNNIWIRTYADKAWDNWKSIYNSKLIFTEQIGDTTSNIHAKLDRNLDFEAISWIDRNYNEVFGNQWCFIKSLKIGEDYGFQFLISCQTKTAVATRYYEKGIWGKWSVIS